MTERNGDEAGRLARLRRKWPWLDHLVRANASYTEHYGNHYAAAITYFSILSLIPILMVAFAIAGYVLAGNAGLLADLQSAITRSMPGELGTTLTKVIAQAIQARATVGVVGLLIALYSGIGWMGNLRDALTAQWGQARGEQPLLRTMLRDLLALLGLGVALLVSFGITAAGTGVGELVLRLIGVADTGWARTALIALSVVLSVLANWLVFLWVITRLPRTRVPLRSAVRGALVAALGFEVLKQLATVLLRSVAHSPTGSVFGSIIGLLVFANLVSRFLLLVTAWTATADDQPASQAVPMPPPAVIRPIVRPRTGFGPTTAAALLAAGTVAGLTLRRRR